MQKVNRTLDMELGQESDQEQSNQDQDQSYQDQDIETFESNTARETLHSDAVKTRTILMDKLKARAAEAEVFRIAARNLLDFSRTAQAEAVIVRSEAEKTIRRACLFELYPSIIAVSSALKAESTLGAAVDADQTTFASAIEAESEHTQATFARAAEATAKATIATAEATAATLAAAKATAEATAATVAATKATRTARAAASALAINAAQLAEADAFVASLTEHTVVRTMMPIKRKMTFVFHFLPKVPS